MKTLMVSGALGEGVDLTHADFWWYIEGGQKLQGVYDPNTQEVAYSGEQTPEFLEIRLDGVTAKLNTRELWL